MSDDKELNAGQYKYQYKKMMIRMLKIYTAIVTLLISLSAIAQQSALQRGFTTVPDTTKPSVYWYWMSDNISQEGVKQDIEAMAKIGIGRAFIGNIGYPKEEVPYGKIKLFSDEWWKITNVAITTATKNNVDIGIFNSPGWSQSGGPWIKPSQSMRYLAGEEIHIKGPVDYARKLPATKANFQDVALLAFPTPAADGDVISKHSPRISSSIATVDAAKWVDGNTATTTAFPTDITEASTFNIDIAVDENFTARSLTLYPAETPFRADVELQVNDNNGYHTIKQFEFNRSNPEINVGFIPFAPVAVSFDKATAKQYRLVFTHVQGKAGLAEIKLSAAPVVERFEEKQLAKMFQTPLPLWNEYQWPQQPEPDDKSITVDPLKVIDITKNLAADGTLNWKVPAGDWIVIRYGMLPTGVTNSPASVEGKGLEMDKINKAYIQHHFDSFAGKILNSIAPADRKALKWIVADSYETGSQNWTDGMAADFKKQYGYDPLPWLPVLSGRVVENADKSSRFLWDLRRLVADKVAYDYVAGMREVSHQHGLKLWLENYGHWGFPSEFLKYGGQSDEVAGEFWNEGTLGNIECRAASSCAHIYGKTKVAAESFTAGGLAYARYPGMLKKRGDWSFTEGINNTLLHVFIEQPYDDRKPGVNAGFGTEFNRNNTWFYQGKVFVDYIRRCNFLLQQGKPVNDVAYFIGEDAPKMTGTRNPELPAGYQFDYINAEVIENRLSVKDGRLVLPDGMSYRLLVLPPLETIRPELLHKIKSLMNEGAVVLGPAPVRSPSMQNYAASDKTVQQLADELWGKSTEKSKKVGKGMLLNNITMEEAFQLLNTVPDVAFNADSILYTHRTTSEGDFYFISNQANKTVNFSPDFRITGKQPELWDAVTGSTRMLPSFKQNQNSTTVPLQLEAYQSAFIVFRKKIASAATQQADNFPKPATVTELKNPWTVSFDAEKRGPVKPVIFNELSDWSKSDNDSIKNYSGTAVYHTSFTANQFPAGQQIFLNLGAVSVMAKVKLNGKEVGTVWTAPYRLDVTGIVKQGENKLEVEVVNTWVNRLIGDSKLPEAQRKTWSNVNTYTPESKYETAGLIGPVVLQAVDRK